MKPSFQPVFGLLRGIVMPSNLLSSAPLTSLNICGGIVLEAI